jgi:phage-related protein
MAVLRPVRWIGQSREVLREFPDEVRRNIGQALQFAQAGTKHPSSKPLHGFGGAGVLEIVEDHDGDAYRAVYTVRFKNVIYVLHAFMKKSKSGSRTPEHDMNVVRSRLLLAQRDYQSGDQ